MRGERSGPGIPITMDLDIGRFRSGRSMWSRLLDPGASQRSRHLLFQRRRTDHRIAGARPEYECRPQPWCAVANTDDKFQLTGVALCRTTTTRATTTEVLRCASRLQLQVGVTGEQAPVLTGNLDITVQGDCRPNPVGCGQHAPALHHRTRDSSRHRPPTSRSGSHRIRTAPRP